MLDINEYNKLLYRQLDKEVKKKEMMTDYGRYLQHSKNTGSESNVELQAASWLANFRGLTTSNGFLKTPQGMKEICEGLIPQASKLLRKANKKGAPEETKAELRNARKFLEDCLADANAALQHSDEDPEHLEHGGKWRHHDYIDIKNGRYIYAKDLKKSSLLQNIDANKKPVIKPAGPQGPVATGTTKHKAPGMGPREYDNVQAVKLSGKDEAVKKEGPIQKRKREEVAKDNVLDKEQQYQESHANAIAFNEKKKQARETAAKGEKREQVLKQISESKEVDDYAKEIAAAYEKGLIKMDRHKTNGGFDTTKEWRDNPEYDALLAAANKAEEYCKKVAEESNGATDWWDVRKELEERILRPIIDKYTNKQKAGNAQKAVTEAEDRERWKRERMQHSDNSPSMTATAMSKDEYEELLKKVESLT